MTDTTTRIRLAEPNNHTVLLVETRNDGIQAAVRDDDRAVQEATDNNEVPDSTWSSVDGRLVPNARWFTGACCPVDFSYIAGPAVADDVTPNAEKVYAVELIFETDVPGAGQLSEPDDDTWLVLIDRSDPDSDPQIIYRDDTEARELRAVDENERWMEPDPCEANTFQQWIDQVTPTHVYRRTAQLI